MQMNNMIGQMMNNQVQNLMNQLQQKNPQAYNLIRQAQQQGINPNDLFKQVTRNYTPEQMNNLFANARQYGFPNDFLEQMQNNK